MSEFNKGFAVFIDYFGYILLQSDFFFSSLKITIRVFGVEGG